MRTAVALDPAVSVALRAALALLFAWAAMHKLRDIVAFRATLANYELLPHGMTAVAAAAVVAVELSIAVSLPLVSGSVPALAATLLLVTYTVAIVINVRRGRLIACGCSGPARERPVSGAMIARNCLIILVALSAALPASSRQFAWIDVVTISGSVALLILLYAVIDQIATNSLQARRGQAPKPSSPQPPVWAIGEARQ